MPRGRRPVLQLKSPVGGTSYLARYGCYSNSGDASGQHQNKEGDRVTNLVGDYPDSDTESEEVPSTPPATSSTPVPNLTDIPMPPSTKQAEQPDSRIDPVIDDEVAHFLAEIDAISSVSTEDSISNQKPSSSSNDKDGIATKSSLPSEESLPSHPKSEVEPLSSRMDVDSPQPPDKDTKHKSMLVLGQPAEKDSKYKSMFVQGQSEFSDKDKSDVAKTNSNSSHLKYKSMFVKGQSEFVLNDEKIMADGVKKPSENSSELGDDELPKEPVSLWQQCLDEHTQFHYYWHTVTNEVTWEIPPEYTQYLLLYKEYEERIARIPPEKLAKLKEKKLKSEKTENKQHVAEEQKKKSICKPSDEQDVPSTVIQNKEHSDSSKTKPKHKSHTTDKPEKTETKSASQPSVIEKVKSERNESKVDHSTEHKSSKSKHKHKHKNKDRDSKHESKEKHSVTEKIDTDKAVDSKVDAATADDDVDVDFDIDDIDRALELALERKKAELQHLEDAETTSVPKKPESQLKRPSSPIKADVSQVSTPPSPKRQKLVAYGADEDDSETEQDSQSEKEASVCSETSQDKQPPIPSLVKIKDEVEDQANIALGKLEFLEVTKKGLSRLQVLLLELQTRFRDWQDGGLNTDYFLERLSEANSQLKQYEQSAVPHGWTCHWDRNFRRYFYTNMTTGESRWDYPDIEMIVPPPPPPADLEDGKDSCEGEQRVSCSSLNKPVVGDLVTNVTLPSAEVSTTTSDPHRVPDTSSKMEDVLEGPQLPDSVAVFTEESTVVGGCSPTIVAIAVQPGEPPPPGPDPPEPAAPRLSSTQGVETDPAAALLDSTEAIDGMPYSPDSSDDVKDDFDIDQMLESTVISMAAENRQKNAAVSIATDDSPKTVKGYSKNSTLAAEGYPNGSAISVTAEGYAGVSMTPEGCAKNASVVAMIPEATHLATAVIYQPPKTNVGAGSSAVTTVQPPVPYQPLGDQPALPSDSPANSPLPAPDDEPSSSTQEEVEKHERKKKKKDKEKKISSTSLTYKKKNVSSLVQKWHQVKVQVEQEEKLNEERQMAIRQKLEEWKQTHS